MKITIKIDPETLFLLQRISLERSQFKTRNIGKSMRIELFEILSRKCIAYSTNPNGKPRTIELRFHLAAQLLEDVKNAINYDDSGTFEMNKLEIFKNQLHQKLL